MSGLGFDGWGRWGAGDGRVYSGCLVVLYIRYFIG